MPAPSLLTNSRNTGFAFVGGRPGMISAATGAMALLMVTLVKEHGLEYLLAATLLTGLLQIGAGYLKLGGLINEIRILVHKISNEFIVVVAIAFADGLPSISNA